MVRHPCGYIKFQDIAREWDLIAALVMRMILLIAFQSMNQSISLKAGKTAHETANSCIAELGGRWNVHIGVWITTMIWYVQEESATTTSVIATLHHELKVQTRCSSCLSESIQNADSGLSLLNVELDNLKDDVSPSSPRCGSTTKWLKAI